MRYLSFQPVLYNWCTKKKKKKVEEEDDDDDDDDDDEGCGVVHLNDALLLIRNSGLSRYLIYHMVGPTLSIRQ